MQDDMSDLQNHKHEVHVFRNTVCARWQHVVHMFIKPKMGKMWWKRVKDRALARQGAIIIAYLHSSIGRRSEQTYNETHFNSIVLTQCQSSLWELKSLNSLNKTHFLLAYWMLNSMFFLLGVQTEKFFRHFLKFYSQFGVFKSFSRVFVFLMFIHHFLKFIQI